MIKLAHILCESDKPIYEKTFDEYRKENTEESILADSDAKRSLKKIKNGVYGFSIEKNNDGYYYTVYRDEQGIPKAFISFSKYKDGYKIIWLYVDKSLRGKGISHKLLNYSREHISKPIYHSNILSDEGAKFAYDDEILQAIKQGKKIPQNVIDNLTSSYLKNQIAKRK